MSFLNISFWFICLTVCSIYWLIPKKYQNILLLLASYFFYATWEWRFLSLLIISTFVDFIAAHFVTPNQKSWKKVVAISSSLAINLGLLFYFKYWTFIFGSWLDLGLPIGISFYTFQTISYTLDVYKGRIKPTDSIIDFALFVSFFPQLIAGPIEKAKRLMPQLQSPSSFNLNFLKSAFYLILMGLFKKVYVAEGLAHPVENIFNNPNLPSPYIFLGGVLTTIQVYADFAGYSDIARGIAKLFGINLLINFKPFIFVTNPSDFWKNWHISLSSWIRDYLIIGLGATKYKIGRYFYILIIMSVIGIWHGPSINWLLFGIFHGLMIISYTILKKQVSLDKFPVYLSKSSGFLIMLLIYYISGLLHQTRELDDIMKLTHLLFNDWDNPFVVSSLISYSLLFIFPLFTYEYFQYKTKNYDLIETAPTYIKVIFISVCILGVFFFERSIEQRFIYFDF